MKARYTVIDGEIIAEKRSSVRSLYVPDPLGSTRGLINNAQTQTDTFSYWPYGEQQSRTGTTSTPFQFVGTPGYYLNTSGKEYVRARYLDKSKGRWLTQDPVGYQGESLNLYWYVANSPVNFTDPLGLGIDFTIPGYKYCGPNLGRKYDPCAAPGNKPGDPPDPKNCIDQCCKDHDCCWDKVKKADPKVDCGAFDYKKKPPWTTNNEACNACNRSFCDCVNNQDCPAKDKLCQFGKNLILGSACKKGGRVAFPQ